MHNAASSPTTDVVAYRQQVRVSISARTICNSLFEPAFYDFGDEQYLVLLSAGARPAGKISKGFWEKRRMCMWKEMIGRVLHTGEILWTDPIKCERVCITVER